MKEKHKLWNTLNDLQFLLNYTKENDSSLPEIYYEKFNECIKEIDKIIMDDLNPSIGTIPINRAIGPTQ